MQGRLIFRTIMVSLSVTNQLRILLFNLVRNHKLGKCSSLDISASVT